MAIATSHTIHVALLPDSSQLDTEDISPLRLKTFQLGPTAHVLEEQPLAAVLWHPLGYRGRALVTITTDAIVRLWELNRSDRSTFNEPALSIDLMKLANATSEAEDLSASKYGASKGFSPDSVELEVVSACFGDFPEQEDVHGWAPMTLWIATREGDVYALCPFLPSRWQLDRSEGASAFIQTLATTINTSYALVGDDPEASAEEKENSKKQLAWLSDILYEPPLGEALPSGDFIDVYRRPPSVPSTPLLQGPFSLLPELDDDIELSDIIVFSLKTFAEATDDGVVEGQPAAVLCLVTTDADILICLDLEGVVGRWLPQEMVSPYPILVEPKLIICSTNLRRQELQTLAYLLWKRSNSGVQRRPRQTANLLLPQMFIWIIPSLFHTPVALPMCPWSPGFGG